MQASEERQTKSRAIMRRRRWVAALFTGALVVGAAGAGAAVLFKPDQKPAPVATGQPATPSSTTAPSATKPAATSTSSRAPVAAPPSPVPTVSNPALKKNDPASWSSRQLAAVLVMTGAKMGDAPAIEHAAVSGLGGVVLFGPSSANLAQTLRKAKAAAPQGNAPLIASDEEGGQVQRLSSLIYVLPSAETMGHWSPAKITRTARDYALKMRALGVNVALGPDADIAVPGYFIADAGRSFSAEPRTVGVAVNAWNDGLESAGVLGVVKHWPGHGQSTDTHVGSSIVPRWSALLGRDLIPFKSAFAHRGGAGATAGASAVMIGHLRVPGLTEGTLPTSQSTTALRALRTQAGPATLIVTDDLSMAAASTELGISPARAAVRSLVAGADVAMVCWAPVDQVTEAIRQAINDGRLPRKQAVASARRVLRAKLYVAAER